MTVIVGHRDGWMVADMMSSIHNNIFMVDKIVKLTHGLLASAGHSLLKQVIKPKADTLEQLLTYVRDTKNDNQIIYVGRDRALLYIADQGITYDPPLDFWASGSGQDMVLGYLAGKYSGCTVLPEHAQEAIAWAAQFNNTFSACSTVARL